MSRPRRFKTRGGLVHGTKTSKFCYPTTGEGVRWASHIRLYIRVFWKCISSRIFRTTLDGDREFCSTFFDKLTSGGACMTQNGRVDSGSHFDFTVCSLCILVLFWFV